MEIWKIITENFDTIAEVFGVISSLATVIALIIALCEYRKNYHVSIQVESKLGTVFNIHDNTCYFSLNVKLKNNSPLSIKITDIFIGEKKGDGRLGCMQFDHDINGESFISPRTTKNIAFFVKYNTVKKYIACDNMTESHLNEKIYVIIDTSAKTYYLKTGYTLNSLLSNLYILEEEHKNEENVVEE